MDRESPLNLDVVNPYYRFYNQLDYVNRHNCLRDEIIRCFLDIIFLRKSIRKSELYLDKNESRKLNINCYLPKTAVGSVDSGIYGLLEKKKNQIIDTSISKILNVSLKLISDLKAEEVIKEILEIIEEAMKALPQLILFPQTICVYTETFDKIKRFIYKILKEEQSTEILEKVVCISMIMMEKLGGLNNVFDWLATISLKINERENVDINISVETVHQVLQSLIIGNDQLSEETKSHISECVDLYAGTVMSLEAAIDLIIKALEVICNVQKCQDIDRFCFCNIDNDIRERASFNEIVVWSPDESAAHFDTEVVKPAFPDGTTSAFTKLGAVHFYQKKSCISQVLLTERNMMVVNGTGHLRCRNINQKRDKSDSIANLFFQCWYPIQFLDSSLKILKVTSNRTREGELEHFLALTILGQVYSWGDGSYGKLGHGNCDQLCRPQLIAGLEGFKIRDISCGPYHSAAVSRSGKVLCWGAVNCYSNQLSGTQLIPELIKDIELVWQVNCGETFTLLTAIDRKRLIFLGSNSRTEELLGGNICLPQYPQCFNLNKVAKVAKVVNSTFGVTNTDVIVKTVTSLDGIIVLMSDRSLYSLGKGLVIGPCSISSDEEQRTSVVHREFEFCKGFNNKSIEDVDVSDHHVAVLYQDATVLSWTRTRKINQSPLKCRPSLNHPNAIVAFWLISEGKPLNLVWSQQNYIWTPNFCKCANKYSSGQLYQYKINPFLNVSNWCQLFSQMKRLLFDCNFIIHDSNRIIRVLKMFNLIFVIYSDRRPTDLSHNEDLDSLIEIILDLIRVKFRNSEIIEVCLNLLLNISCVCFNDSKSVCKKLFALLVKDNELRQWKNLDVGEIGLLVSLLDCFYDNVNNDTVSNLGGRLPFVTLLDVDSETFDSLTLYLSQISANFLLTIFQSPDKVSSSQYKLFRSISQFLNQAYAIYVYTSISDLKQFEGFLQLLCCLLPIINRLVGGLKLLLQQHQKKTDFTVWLCTNSYESVDNSLNSEVGGKTISQLLQMSILGQPINYILRGLVELDRNNVLSLVPHLGSLMMSLNSICILMPFTAINDRRQIHWPLFGFSGKPNLSVITEIESNWNWLMDLERLVGYTFGYLYCHILQLVSAFKPRSAKVSAFNIDLINQLVSNVTIGDKINKNIQEIERFYVSLTKGLNYVKGIANWKYGRPFYNVGFEMSTLVFNFYQSWFPDFDLRTADEDRLDSFRRSLGWLMDSVDKYAEKRKTKFKSIEEIANHLKYRCGLIHKKLKEKSEMMFEFPKFSLDDHFVDLSQDANMGDVKEVSNNSEEPKEMTVFKQICCNMEYVLTAPDLSDKFYGQNTKENEVLEHEKNDTASDTMKSQISVKFLETYYNVIGNALSFMDFVFLQILNGILEAIEGHTTTETTDPNCIHWIEKIVELFVSKLKKSYENNSKERKCNRLNISLIQAISGHLTMCLRNSNFFITICIDSDYWDLLCCSNDNGNVLSTGDKWLIIEGAGDANMIRAFNFTVWSALEMICLLFKYLYRMLPVEIKHNFQQKWLSFLLKLFEIYKSRYGENKLDLYGALNLTKFMLTDTEPNSWCCDDRYRKLFNEIGSCIDILYTFHHEDNGTPLHIKYGIQILAIDCFFLMKPLNLEQDKVIYSQIEKFFRFCSQIQKSSSNRLVEEIIEKFQQRQELQKSLQVLNKNYLENCDNWIYYNCNFDKGRVKNCEIVRPDVVRFGGGKNSEVNEKEVLAVSKEILTCGGVWRVTMEVTSNSGSLEPHSDTLGTNMQHSTGSDDDIDFGFIPSGNCSWAHLDSTSLKMKYDSVASLSIYSLGGRAPFSKLITVVIDFDEEYAVFSHKPEVVQYITCDDFDYNFFVRRSISTTNKYIYHTEVEIQLMSICQLKSSNMNKTRVQFYQTKGTVLPDETIIYYRFFTGLANWWNSVDSTDFVNLFLTNLIGQLDNCRSQMLFADWTRSSDPGSETVLFKFLFLLMDQNNDLLNECFHRGQICTYRSVDISKDGENVETNVSDEDKEERDLMNCNTFLETGIILNFSYYSNHFNLPGLCLQKEEIINSSNIECQVYSLDTASVLRMPLSRLMKNCFDINTNFIRTQFIFIKLFSVITQLLNNLERIIPKRFYDIVTANSEEGEWCSNDGDMIEIEYQYVKYFASELYIKLLSNEMLMEAIRNNQDLGKFIGDNSLKSIFKHYRNMLSLACSNQPIRGIHQLTGLFRCTNNLFDLTIRMSSEMDSGLPRHIGQFYMKRNNDNETHLGRSGSFHNPLPDGDEERILHAIGQMKNGKELLTNYLQPVSPELNKNPQSSPQAFGSITFSRRRKYASGTSLSLLNQVPQQEFDMVTRTLRDTASQNVTRNIISGENQSIAKYMKKKTVRCPICNVKSDRDSNIFYHLSEYHPVNCDKQFQHKATKSISSSGAVSNINSESDATNSDSVLYLCATITKDSYVVCDDYINRLDHNSNRDLRQNTLLMCAGTMVNEHIFIHPVDSDSSLTDEFQIPVNNETDAMGGKFYTEIYTSDLDSLNKNYTKKSLNEGKLNMRNIDLSLITQLNTNVVKKVFNRLSFTNSVLQSRRLLVELMKLLYQCETRKEVNVKLQELFSELNIRSWERLFKLVECGRFCIEKSKLVQEHSTNVDFVKIEFQASDLVTMFISGLECCLLPNNSLLVKEFIGRYITSLELLILSSNHQFCFFKGSDANVTDAPSFLHIELYTPLIMKIMFNKYLYELDVYPWLIELEKIVELFALGVQLDLKSDKFPKFRIWCLKMLMFSLQELKKLAQYRSGHSFCTNFQRPIDSKLTEPGDNAIDVTNGEALIKHVGYLSQSNCILTADADGTLRIWNFNSGTGPIDDRPKQIFLFSMSDASLLSSSSDGSAKENVGKVAEDETKEECPTAQFNKRDSYLQIQELLSEDLSVYLMAHGLQKITCSSPCGKFLAESLGVVLNIWSANHLDRSAHCITFSSIVTVLEFARNAAEGEAEINLTTDCSKHLMVGTATGQLTIICIQDSGSRIIQYPVPYLNIIESSAKSDTNANVENTDPVETVASSVTAATWCITSNPIVVGFHNGNIMLVPVTGILTNENSVTGDKLESDVTSVQHFLGPLHYHRIVSLVYCPYANYQRLFLSSAADESYVGVWNETKLLCVIYLETNSTRTATSQYSFSEIEHTADTVFVTHIQWCPNSFVFNDDTRVVMIGASDGSVQCNSLSNMNGTYTVNPVFCVRSHMSAIVSVSISASHKLMATGCSRGWLRVWSLRDMIYIGQQQTVSTLASAAGTTHKESVNQRDNGSYYQPTLILSDISNEGPIAGIEWYHCQSVPTTTDFTDIPVPLLVVAWARSVKIRIYRRLLIIPSVKQSINSSTLISRQWAVIRSYLPSPTYSTNSINGQFKHLQNFFQSLASVILIMHEKEQPLVDASKNLVYSPFLQALIEFCCRVPNLIKSFEALVSPCYLDIIGRSNYQLEKYWCLSGNKYSTGFTFLLRVAEFAHLTPYVTFSIDNDYYEDNDELNEIPSVMPPRWWWTRCADNDETLATRLITSKWKNEFWTKKQQMTSVSHWKNVSKFCEDNQTISYGLTWGIKDKDQLSVESLEEPDQTFVEPHNLEVNSQLIADREEIDTIVCGNAVTLVVTGDGSLLATGEGVMLRSNPYLRQDLSRLTPVPILTDLKVTSVSASLARESHIAAVTVLGDVYSWGNGTHGKLGHGYETSMKKPHIVEMLRGHRVVQVSCGHQHTAVVTESGAAYTFGLGTSGQLGVDMHGEAHRGLPCLVTITDHTKDYNDITVKISMVACGQNHTLLLDQTNNQIYAFGDGSYGKLGTGNTTNELYPTPIFIGCQEKMLKVVCGQNISGVLLNNGRIITWGHPNYVGHGRKDDKIITSSNVAYSPSTVIGLSGDCFNLVSGNETMMALTYTADGVKLFGWGSNRNGLLLQNKQANTSDEIDVYDCDTIYHAVEIEISDDNNSIWKQVSCGVRHAAVSPYRQRNTPKSPWNWTNLRAPILYRTVSKKVKSSDSKTDGSNSNNKPTPRHLLPPSDELDEIDLWARLNLLHYWSELARLTWQYWLPLTRPTLSNDSSTLIDMPYSVFGTIFHSKKDIQQAWPVPESMDGSHLFYWKSQFIGWPHLQPLHKDDTRMLLYYLLNNGASLMSALHRVLLTSSPVLSAQNLHSGPLVQVNRFLTTDITTDDTSVQYESVCRQIMDTVLHLNPELLIHPSRAWKVQLVNEGADDAGGAYDETISELCTEMREGRVFSNTANREPEEPLITISSNDNTGYHTLLLAPVHRGSSSQLQAAQIFKIPHTGITLFDSLRFLGILMAVAIRTGKPLDLALDKLVWSILCRARVQWADLHATDPAYFSSLISLLNIPALHLDRDYLKEWYNLGSCVCYSANKKRVELMYSGETRSPLTMDGQLDQFVCQAIQLRVSEIMQSVEQVRKGMDRILPLPLFDLICSAHLETLICGEAAITVAALRKIVRYIDTNEKDPIIQWLWEILETFTDEELCLFLRFTTGKSRLPPASSNQVQFHIFICLTKKPKNSLPQAQTCFNQIRLPQYSTRSEMESKLRLAVTQCRSIDLDGYMLNP